MPWSAISLVHRFAVRWSYILQNIVSVYFTKHRRQDLLYIQENLPRISSRNASFWFMNFWLPFCMILCLANVYMKCKSYWGQKKSRPYEALLHISDATMKHCKQCNFHLTMQLTNLGNIHTHKHIFWVGAWTEKLFHQNSLVNLVIQIKYHH